MILRFLSPDMNKIKSFFLHPLLIVFLLLKSFLMVKKKGFTLVEMVLVIIISVSILTTIYGVMTVLPRVKNFNDARQNLIEQTNKVMNDFSILFQDYTIDYEEYFNRKMVGCDGQKKGSAFEWAVNASGHCDFFTAYGNENSKQIALGTNDVKDHLLQYCSSDPKEGNPSGLIHYQNCLIA